MCRCLALAEYESEGICGLSDQYLHSVHAARSFQEKDRTANLNSLAIVAEVRMERFIEGRLLSGLVLAASRVTGSFGAAMIAWSMSVVPTASASHQGHASHADAEVHVIMGSGHSIPDAPFQVFLGQEKGGREEGVLTPFDADAALKTVIDAFTILLQHRADYPRFDESLRKDALKQVVIESSVVNDEGKAFPFLVARTKEPGRVTLLISAASLKDKGYLNHPDTLAPVLAREFQWVVSKADTASKPKILSGERDLPVAPIRTDQDIQSLPADERARILQRLFDTYLRTVDDQKSLVGQPYFEVGNSALVQPTHQDSTIKLYEIRIREAMQKIVREPARR